MKTLLLCGTTAVIAVAFIGAPAFSATDIPLNSPTTVNGIDTVCTGIGDSAENEARWAAYPLKIVLAGKGGQYLADADVTLTKDGKEVVSVHCGGPWVLMKVPAGRYRITGVIEGESAEANAFAPASGQGRAILRFSDRGGAISPEHKETP